jgi:hypothetical protein
VKKHNFQTQKLSSIATTICFCKRTHSAFGPPHISPDKLRRIPPDKKRRIMQKNPAAPNFSLFVKGAMQLPVNQKQKRRGCII